MIVRTPFQRLQEKSYPQCLALRLAQDYDLSPVEAATLSDELIRERSCRGGQSLFFDIWLFCSTFFTMRLMVEKQRGQSLYFDV